MYRPQLSPTPRKGVILLVVLAMLTLFTIIGISFVLYANAAATQSLTAKEGNNIFRPEMEPEECMSFFLNQLIYDVRDDASGVYSSLRGHSLSRNMYGLNYNMSTTTLSVRLGAGGKQVTVTSSAGFPVTSTTTPLPNFVILVDAEYMTVTAVAGKALNMWTVTRGSNGSTAASHAAGATVSLSPILQIGNDVAFNGIGRLHYQFPMTGTQWNDATTGMAIDDWKMVNYMYYPTDGFVRDPELYNSPLRTSLANPRGQYIASANVPYTYPDINNMYLGAIDGSGNLLTPSFHREWLFGRLDGYPGNTSGTPLNANWGVNNDGTSNNNAIGKYLTMRPRPIENPNFPYPVDRGGDVKNLIGYPGGCDSIWIDIGAPVMTAPDGRKYKMLVAPLILDMDGRLNVNAHGNIKGGTATVPTNASNQGLGSWEVNLSQLLKQPGATAAGPLEWVSLFNGATGANQQTLVGRYGQNKVPLITITPASNVAPTIPQPHPYSQIDYDSLSKTYPLIPGMTGSVALSPFPSYPAAATGYDNASPAALKNHSMLYQAFSPFGPQANGNAESNYWNRNFRPSNMERLFRLNDTGYESLTSELELFLPNNLKTPVAQLSKQWPSGAVSATSSTPPGNATNKIPNLLTTTSGDRNQPGISPFASNFISAPGGGSYQVPATQLDQPPVWTGTPLAFPALSPLPTFPTGVPPTTTAPGTPGTVPPTDFTTDWRSAITASTPNGGQGLWRLDLNNPIPSAAASGSAPYTPAMLTPYPFLTTTATLKNAMVPRPFDRFDDSAADLGTFQKAQQDRQFMARQIYLRLLAVAGLTPNGAIPASPTDLELRPRRWLAQLAVNIVDYIDNDDIITPFNFYTAQDANLKNFDISASVLQTTTTPATVDVLPGPFMPSPNPQSPPPYPPFQNPYQNPNTYNPKYTPAVNTPKYWVFGTELPRVVINEVLAEYVPPTENKKTVYPVNVPVNVWVELYNPMMPSTSTNPSVNDTNVNTIDGNVNVYPVNLGMAQTTSKLSASPAAYAAYRLILGDEIMLPPIIPPPTTTVTNPPPPPPVVNATATPATTSNNNVMGLPYNIRSWTATTEFASYVELEANNTTGYRTVNKPATIAAGQYVIVAPNGILDANQTVAAVGSKKHTNGAVPVGTAVYQSSAMTYPAQFLSKGSEPYEVTTGLTVLLQRLANPHMPPDDKIVIGTAPNLVPNPTYNPYITIDYIEKVPLNDATLTTPNMTPPQTAKMEYSVGKRQPYASRIIRRASAPFTNAISPVAHQATQHGQVFHTLGNTMTGNLLVGNQPASNVISTPTKVSPNAGAGFCDWLPHLDRAVTSPMELLHVSQYQPHQLTQKFMLADTSTWPPPATLQVYPTITPVPNLVPYRYQHAPVSTWYNEQTRLYRFFEFVEVRDRATGSTDPQDIGHTTGKININSIWDFETFMALCDPQAMPATGKAPTPTTNYFNQLNVQYVWNQLLTSRSPNYAAGVTGNKIGPTNMQMSQIAPGTTYPTPDRPFLGHAQGLFMPNTTAYSQFPNGQGINDTIFRSTSSSYPDFTPPNLPPARLFDLPLSPLVTGTAAQPMSMLPANSTGPTNPYVLNTDNPYVTNEMLRKIFNNVTTRSNVFAVWTTVGFFEVTPRTDSTGQIIQPWVLGAEMNAAEGRAVRHRMFAIIDRSRLKNNPYPSQNVVSTTMTVTVTNPTGYTSTATTPPPTSWQLGTFNLLPPAPPLVSTTPGTVPWWGTPISITTTRAATPGNPMPAPYRPGADPSVIVPYWAIID